MRKPTRVENPSLIFKSPQMLLAFGFGSGLSKVVPGTMGTLAAIPFYLLMAQLDWWLYGVIIVLTTLLGIYLCSYASRVLNVHDHSGIVWDEFVGFWITMFMVPVAWEWIIIGFLLFRFFDMVKPWPISLADKYIHGGFGIMFDDVLAGLAALGCMQILVALI